MIAHEKASLMSSNLNSRSSKLVFPPQNLVDLIWKDKPPKLKEPIFIQPIEFTGKLAFSAWQLHISSYHPSNRQGFGIKTGGTLGMDRFW
jgi:hypothetical protein